LLQHNLGLLLVLLQVHAIQGDLFVEGNRTKIGVLPLLQQSMAHPYDIFIVNFGGWANSHCELSAC
jgi:hypothetical protein